MKTILFTAFSIVLIVLQCYIKISAQPHENQKVSSIKPAGFCELFNSLKYDEKPIRTSAVLYLPAEGEPRVDGNSDDVFYSTSCNNKDYFAIADFLHTENFNRIKKASRRSGSAKPILLRVVLSGKFSLSLIPTFGHLSWLRAQLQVDRIYSVELIKSEHALPDFESNAAIIDAGSSLRSLNSEMVFSFFGRGLNSSQLQSLYLERTKITVDNKPISMERFLEISSNQKGGELALRVSDVSRSGKIWRIQGTVANITENGKTAKLKYDNRYQFQEDKSWKLISSNVSYSI